MSKCWYCNNDLTTGDNPKHFGICNKCYDEMFKSGDAIIRSLTNKIAELKQKAIVPKYKIKQHIWLARNNEFQKEPCELIVQNIEYNFKTEEFLYIVDFVEKGHHKSINMCDNGDLFATKEEAQAKLNDLGEKK